MCVVNDIGAWMLTYIDNPDPQCPIQTPTNSISDHACWMGFIVDTLICRQIACCKRQAADCSWLVPIGSSRLAGLPRLGAACVCVRAVPRFPIPTTAAAVQPVVGGPAGCPDGGYHTVQAYYTADFTDFTDLGVALTVAARLPGTEFRPHVVFNPKSKKFLMWFEDRGWVIDMHGVGIHVGPRVGGSGWAE